MTPARTFSRTFQGTPMRHPGADVGNFFLAEKAHGEAFTDDDARVAGVVRVPGRATRWPCAGRRRRA